ncbi:Asp-tRNA(Asn)/Glu-tRNA(Gln) amidotransferase subunit GatC [Holophaga foetida]|uniref:Asp-tRNA(Asn)/Glu-tRNA(Gln) amidotransferase subunit GatC n=1 Tax=Holophaga foetida TaxID=35839 RepID=UPI0002471768|nr:Asp-tRNA(Asn)/Glu-tRNA(Gln) amidotransferase subunit GatC [Holophaga foetida]
MEVTREDVQRCALLTHLSLGEEEIEPMRRAMTQLLSHAKSLDALDLEGIEATTHGQDLPLPRRGDEPREGLSQTEALENAPAQEHGHFQVPKVL